MRKNKGNTNNMDSDCRDKYQTKSLSAIGEASRRRIERNSHDADELGLMDKKEDGLLAKNV